MSNSLLLSLFVNGNFISTRPLGKFRYSDVREIWEDFLAKIVDKFVIHSCPRSGRDNFLWIILMQKYAINIRHNDVYTYLELIPTSFINNLESN